MIRSISTWARKCGCSINVYLTEAGWLLHHGGGIAGAGDRGGWQRAEVGAEGLNGNHTLSLLFAVPQRFVL